MLARYCFLVGLLCWLPAAHGAEAEDPSLEVIEMLGESDGDATELEIAMSEIKVSANDTVVLPKEEKNDK
jgi:hypothetical protein